MARQRKVAQRIVTAVQRGALSPHFKPQQISRAVKISLDTARVFLDKHRIGNPGGFSELFVRVSRGVYRINKRERDIARRILEAVQRGALPRKFTPEQVSRTIKISLDTARTFLPKHRIGNPGGFSELFVRVARGLYRPK